jgi:hypothetical protein
MRKQSKKCIPVPIIESAVCGDAEAIHAILKHYEGYIAALSTRRLYDEYGNPHFCVDVGLRRRLETKLITAIVSFNAA